MQTWGKYADFVGRSVDGLVVYNNRSRLLRDSYKYVAQICRCLSHFVKSIINVSLGSSGSQFCEIELQQYSSIQHPALTNNINVIRTRTKMAHVNFRQCTTDKCLFLSNFRIAIFIRAIFHLTAVTVAKPTAKPPHYSWQC